MNLLKRNKIVVLVIILVFVFVILFIFCLMWMWKNRVTKEPYGVPYDSILSDAKESADLLSYEDYVYMNESIIFWYCQNERGILEVEKDGLVIKRPTNKELFSVLYENGFEPIESMYIDDNEIGLSFVKGRIYPADYDFRTHKFHVEYGVCFIFDNYINNLPDIKKDFLNSVNINYLEYIYGNIYIYIAERKY